MLYLIAGVYNVNTVNHSATVSAHTNRSQIGGREWGYYVRVNFPTAALLQGQCYWGGRPLGLVRSPEGHVSLGQCRLLCVELLSSDVSDSFFTLPAYMCQYTGVSAHNTDISLSLSLSLSLWYFAGVSLFCRATKPKSSR